MYVDQLDSNHSAHLLIQPEGGVAGESVLAVAMGEGARPQIALSGVRIDNITMDELVATIDGLIDAGGFHQIATANVDFLTRAAGDPALMEILHRCDIVLADGMPLVWASKVMGAPLKERVAGADLLPRMLQLSQRKQRSIFLLGSTEESSKGAVERARREYPEAVICGRLSPAVASLDELPNDEILRQIEAAAPDILLVALGNPKQEKWIAMHRDRLKVPVCVGVGAAIDFFSRVQTRAPQWMQKTGLEWMYRILTDPSRLGPRYLNDVQFLLRTLSAQLLVTSVQPRSTTGSKISTMSTEYAVVVRVAGSFNQSAVAEVRKRLSERVEESCPLIFDLSSTSRLLPDAAGFLSGLTRQSNSGQGAVWLTGLQPGVRNVLRKTFPTGHYFRIAATVQDALRVSDAGSSRQDGCLEDAAVDEYTSVRAAHHGLSAWDSPRQGGVPGLEQVANG